MQNQQLFSRGYQENGLLNQDEFRLILEGKQIMFEENEFCLNKMQFDENNKLYEVNQFDISEIREKMLVILR